MVERNLVSISLNKAYVDLKIGWGVAALSFGRPWWRGKGRA